MANDGSSSRASNLNSNIKGKNEKRVKRNSNDVGCEFGELINPNDLDKLKCRLCGHRCSGGVYRIKQHIAGIRGNVRPCSVAKEDDKKKCKAALDERKNKKRERSKQQQKVRDEVQPTLDEEDDVIALLV